MKQGDELKSYSEGKSQDGWKAY